MKLLLVGLGTFAAFAAHLALSAGMPSTAWLGLALGNEASTYQEVLFQQAALPRAAMAVMVGAALGLAGSVLQQITRNRLVSPLTIGASSGAWFALLAVGVLAPEVTARHGVWIAMAGAVATTGLVFSLAGARGIESLGIVLAGMAMHILLTAAARILILVHGETVRNLFIWGAGDLTQNGWEPALELAPQLGLAAAVVFLCRRPLALMRLGSQGAAGRGLRVWPFALAASLTALWLTAAAIAWVGLIGFIGLLAPNIARLLGARTAMSEAGLSLALGALCLLAADIVALAAGTFTRDLVPTGASSALIGAPALILLASRGMRRGDHAAFARLDGFSRPAAALVPVTAGLVVVACLIALLLGPAGNGWQIALPGDFAFQHRWPRIVSALAAGAGMAVSGLILQRLLRNPLASPDIIGISSGASLALIATLVFAGLSIPEAGAPVAMLGSLGVLATLLMLGRRLRHEPALIALAGIALAATMDALLQFVLARGGEETYMVVNWLAGTTFRVTGPQSLSLLAAVAVLSGIACALARWLTLLSASDAIAAGRGLAVERARPALLSVAAVIAALVTAVVGPVAFIGLVAPHMASLLGARRVVEQLAVALAVGACLFVASDWIGRTMLYPRQVPAGAVASILGGAYLAALLARRRGVAF